MDGRFVTAAVLVAVLSPYSHSHLLSFFKSCKEVEGPPDFDMNQLQGKWYAIRLHAAINPCITFDFQRLGDSNTFNVSQGRELMLLNSVGVDNLISYVGKINFDNEDPARPFEGTIAWPIGGIFDSSTKSTVTVVQLVSDSHMVLYECQDLQFFIRYSVAILFRTKDPEIALIDSIIGDIKAKGLNTGSLNAIDHSQCIKGEDGLSFTIDEPISNVLGLLNDAQIASVSTKEELFDAIGAQTEQPMHSLQTEQPTESPDTTGMPM